MNKHVGTMKEVLNDYLKAVQKACEQMDANKKLYQPDSAEKENERVAAELHAARDKAIEKIKAAQESGHSDIEAWGRPDGSQITPDAELLKNNAVNPEAFRYLTEKYKNNSTMLQLLANYAEKRNQESGGFNAVWGYGRSDGPARKFEHFDTTGLPSAENMQKGIDKYAASALDLVDRISDYEQGKMVSGPNSPIIQASVENFGADT